MNKTLQILIYMVYDIKHIYNYFLLFIHDLDNYQNIYIYLWIEILGFNTKKETKHMVIRY